MSPDKAVLPCSGIRSTSRFPFQKICCSSLFSLGLQWGLSGPGPSWSARLVAVLAVPTAGTPWQWARSAVISGNERTFTIKRLKNLFFERKTRGAPDTAARQCGSGQPRSLLLYRIAVPFVQPAVKWDPSEVWANR